MTYKSSVAGLNLGGGKAVIIGDPRTMKTEKLFRAFGRFVQSLGGRYITAEDVGTSVSEMEWVRMETDYVTGIRRVHGGSGDPSPVTAYGVYYGIKSALEWVNGSNSFKNTTVAIQGVGHVGFYLLQHLLSEGAKVFAADINPDNINKIKKEYPSVEFVDPTKIYDVPCDVFAPCALGGAVNEQTIPRLNCKIVAGSANNVLLHEKEDSLLLEERDITYVPDFVISSGGLVNVANELEGYNKEHALGLARGIGETVLKILTLAKEEGCTTTQAAIEIAKKRVLDIGRIRPNHLGVPLQKRGRGII